MNPLKKKYVKPQYSRNVTIALTVVLAVLLVVLAVVIVLQARQARAERGELPAAAQQLDPTPAPELDPAAAEAQAAAEAARAEEDAAKRAAEAEQYSAYQKLAKGYDVKMLVMGDSVIDGTGASAEDKTWYAQLEKHINEKYTASTGAAFTVEIAAGPGHSLFPDLMSVREGDLASDCDLAVLCYGNEDAVLGFGPYYEVLVRSILEKNPDCSIIFVLEATEGGHSERMVDAEGISAYYSIPVADTFGPYYALGIKGFFGAFADGVHPNDQGHGIYFDAISAAIDDAVAADAGKHELLEPSSEQAKRFENIEYIPASEFTRVDDISYSVDYENDDKTPRTIMVDCGFDINRDNTKVIADDILYNLPRGTGIHDTVNGDRYLFTASTELVVTKSLGVRLKDKTLADDFNGVYLIWQTPEETETK